MFGDGAGAVVLEAEENAVYIQAVHSIGSRGKALTCVSRNQQQFIEKDADISSTYMQMDGKEVFKFAVSKVPEVIMEVLEKTEELGAPEQDGLCLEACLSYLTKLS